MTTNFILIDYENVQPATLDMLHGHPVHVLVFVGANQARGRVSMEFASSMQALGDAAEYVKLTTSGRNALDFHMAFTLGQLATVEPSPRFQLITKDKGLDPLLEHLGRQGIAVERFNEIAEIPWLLQKGASRIDEKVARVAANLRARGGSRPGRRDKLSNAINALFQNALPASELRSIMERLQRDGYLSLEGDAVVYHARLSGAGS